MSTANFQPHRDGFPDQLSRDSSILSQRRNSNGSEGEGAGPAVLPDDPRK